MKNETEEFNRDLTQISHVLSFDFKFLLHGLTKKLIWKKMELKKLS
jgi:hypothetical protein